MSLFRKITLCSVLVVVLAMAFGPNEFYLTPFRESQTAITVRELASGDSPWLAYYTPVLGAPWSWPMEFPLFQWLTAGLNMLGLPLAAAGRLLGLLCFFGCGWVAPRLLAAMVGDGSDLSWVRYLIWGCPLLLIYGGGFLIESLALLASLAYAWLSVRVLAPDVLSKEGAQTGALNSGGERLLMQVLFFGICAALVKPTTWAPAAALVGLFSGTWLLIRSEPLGRRLRRVLLTGLILGLPLVAGLLWVRYSDSIKALHPVASNMVSSEMKAWNYGTLAQKLSPVVWGTIFGRGWMMALGPLGLLIPVFVVWAWRRENRPVETWVAILSLMGAYLVAPLVFTNLYFRHDYYSYANLPYLLMGLAVLGRGAVPLAWLRLGAPVLALSMASISLGYLALKQRYQDPVVQEVVAAVNKLQEPGAVAFLGFDYSAVIPYKTGRRALMLGMTEPDERLAATLRANSGEPYVAVVALGAEYEPAAQAMLAGLGLDGAIRQVMPSGVVIWSAKPSARTEASPVSALSGYIHVRVSNAVEKHGVVWCRLPFSSQQGQGFELIYRRGNQAFVLRSSDMTLQRLRNAWTLPSTEPSLPAVGGQ